MIRHPTTSTLFPYTTLFRSRGVREEAGARVEDSSALHGRRLAFPGHARCDEAARAKLRQVDEIEARDARPHAVELHAREAAALEGELEEPLALQDLEHEPRVLEVVGGERRRVLAVQSLDLRGGVGEVGREELAPPEDRARHGLEPVVHEAECVAHEGDGGEDYPS